MTKCKNREFPDPYLVNSFQSHSAESVWSVLNSGSATWTSWMLLKVIKCLRKNSGTFSSDRVLREVRALKKARVRRRRLTRTPDLLHPDLFILIITSILHLRIQKILSHLIKWSILVRIGKLRVYLSSESADKKLLHFGPVRPVRRNPAELAGRLGPDLTRLASVMCLSRQAQCDWKWPVFYH